MRALVLCCGLCTIGIQSVSESQEPPRIQMAIDSAVTMSQGAAPAALTVLRKLVNRENHRRMGFESLSDVRSATLGDPLVIFYVRLDSLRKYQSGGDAFGLLTAGDEILYPVLVRGETRSSITLGRNPGGWKGLSYGGSNAARLTWRMVNDRRKRAAPAAERYFLVGVPALDVQFIGFEETGELRLIPLLDDPQNRWQAGVLVPADYVFAELALDARAHEDL